MRNHASEVKLKLFSVKCKSPCVNNICLYRSKWEQSKYYIWPVLLHAFETWSIESIHMKKLEAWEMYVVCRLLKISWRQRITKVKKSCWQPIVDRVLLLQLMIQGRIEGKHGSGRKQFSWIRNLRQWHQIDDAETFFLTRHKWWSAGQMGSLSVVSIW